MGFIGFLFVVWLSFQISSVLGGIIGIFVTIGIIIGLLNRIAKKQELKLLRTIGQLVVAIAFSMWMFS